MTEIDRELEDPNNWDYEAAERRLPAKTRRAIVSVAFPPEDFQRVSKTAEAAGLRLSEFIREAAVKASAGGRAQADFVVTGVGGQVILVEVKVAAATRLTTEVKVLPSQESAYSSVA
jgi:hypothetical protein